MKAFFDDLNKLAQPKRRDIIEKDYLLHRLLGKISGDNHLSSSLVFKGGTCLIKAYTGYYRFSEDIDFTWKDTGLWQDKTPSQTRKQCSMEIDKIIERLIPIADELGLDFKGNKSDMGEIIIGAGGRMSRFYLGYHSHILDAPAKIKMEINFVDKTLYPYQTKALQSYIQDIESEKIQFLYKDQWTEYTTPITIQCYDPREIYTEKCRAVLTRIKYKLRDIIDIYKLEKQYGYTIPEYKDPTIQKTLFILDLYHKYQETIETKTLPEITQISREEFQLLTINPPTDFEEHILRIHQQIEELQTELAQRDCELK